MRIFIGSGIIDTDDIAEIKEKKVVFTIPRGLFSEDEYVYKVVQIKVRTGESPIYFDNEPGYEQIGPSMIYRPFKSYTIYSDKELGKRIENSVANRSNRGALIDFGFTPTINGGIENYDYFENNAEYDPDIKTKQDFVKKYLSNNTYSVAKQNASNDSAVDLPDNIDDIFEKKVVDTFGAFVPFDLIKKSPFFDGYRPQILLEKSKKIITCTVRFPEGITNSQFEENVIITIELSEPTEITDIEKIYFIDSGNVVGEGNAVL